MRANPDHLLVLVTTPLLGVMLLAVIDHANRPDLLGNAITAPAIMGLWGTSLLVAGEIVDSDRAAGVLEPAMATPAGIGGAVAGRVLAVAITASLSFVESWLVARLVLHRAVPLHHPAEFVAVGGAVVIATSATALVMAAVFALARSARIFQNSLSYPLYLLGGVLVPVALLPEWLRPVSRVVFLSWASDLLRECFRPEPLTAFAGRLGMVLVLGAGSGTLGWILLGKVLQRVRILGTATYA
jgi:ABC-2 type transport system permease protein